MNYNILKDESFNTDFVKNNIEDILACGHADKHLEVKNIFNTKGLVTNSKKFYKFWEHFAEFLLQKDFKIEIVG